jgi:hypothetical protein
MRILFCGRSTAQFPYHASIVAALLENGHNVRLLYDKEWSGKIAYGASLTTFARKQPNLAVGWSLRRGDRWRSIIFPLRELRSVASYLNRPWQSPFYLKRWINYLPAGLRSFAQNRFGQRLLRSEFVGHTLKQIESIIPSDYGIKREIEAYAPDVVVCSPANQRFSEELEYLKAAKSLGIPTVLPVYSWDNLSTKGLIHVAPDLLLAWNGVHEQEAIDIHGLDPDRIVQTGSPFFDKWFAMQELRESREEFMEKVGLDPAGPYLLYLGSSANIARDESWIVAEISKSLRDTEQEGMQVLVRPHPANNEVYNKVVTEGVSIWPRKRQLPEDPDSQADFINSVRHAVLSVGINTSGMIDALIQDRPVAAFVSEKFKATQEEAVHFQHMQTTGCLYEVHSVTEVLKLAQQIAAGESDAMYRRRRDFVRAMVRPHGLEFDAGRLSAWCIARLGEGMKPDLVKPSLASFLEPAL